MLLIFGAAHADGFDYNQIINLIEEKFTINKNRKWGKPDENGVVNHVKEKSTLGMCMEDGCIEEATSDYNGHGHYVCAGHMRSLSNYFDEEYR